MNSQEVLYLGCGNHACRMEKPKGQGTNSTCSCLDELPTEKRIRVERYLKRQAAQIEALLTLVEAINARDAVEGSPQSFNSGKEYRRTLIEAIDEVKAARAKCRELDLEI